MKKKLEAELISIAHRILKLKNKSELVQLHQETQKLYEKLSVLRFVEENFSDVKPTIGYSEIEEKIATAFDKDADVSDEKPEVPAEVIVESDQTEAISSEETPEAVVEKASDSEEKSNEVEQTAETSEANNAEPIIEAESPEETVSETEREETAETDSTEDSEEKQEESTLVSSEENNPEPETQATETETAPEPFAQTTQETIAEETLATAQTVKETKPEILNDAFKPSFELAFDPKEDSDTDKFNSPAQTSLEDFLHDNYVDPVFVTPEDLQKEKEEKAAQSYASYQSTADTSAKSLNDRMAKGIIIGLNDRIAFMNHLFNNSSEDYNRVLSQLMTIDTFSEAKNFIDTMVKPDYNNWNGKEEYEQRFMEIIEKKFS